MSNDEIITRLRELSAVDKTALTPSQKDEIATLYEYVTGNVFVNTSCNDCYKDACLIAYNYMKKMGEPKAKSIYKMRNGALVQLGFGVGEFLGAHNCTDEKARAYLREHPEDITLFYEYPEDWQNDVKGAQNDAQSDENSADVQVTASAKRKRRTKKED